MVVIEVQPFKIGEPCKRGHILYGIRSQTQARESCQRGDWCDVSDRVVSQFEPSERGEPCHFIDGFDVVFPQADGFEVGVVFQTRQTGNAFVDAVEVAQRLCHFNRNFGFAGESKLAVNAAPERVIGDGGIDPLGGGIG